MYELNRLQKSWYFEIDFNIFRDTQLTSKDREGCEQERQYPLLCQAEAYARARPFIFITAASLGQHLFWTYRDKVAVISTERWEENARPSTYEYLAYSLVVQSLLIHLDAFCGALPERPSQETGLLHGDLFEYLPRREAMKAAILVAHLSREGEDQLFNCFGPEYTRAASELLSLEWLRSPRVRANLKEVYKVE